MKLVVPKMCHFLVTHCMLNIKECIRFRAPQDLVVLDFQIPRSRPEISSFHPKPFSIKDEGHGENWGVHKD